MEVGRRPVLKLRTEEVGRRLLLRLRTEEGELRRAPRLRMAVLPVDMDRDWVVLLDWWVGGLMIGWLLAGRSSGWMGERRRACASLGDVGLGMAGPYTSKIIRRRERGGRQSVWRVQKMRRKDQSSHQGAFETGGRKSCA